MGQQDLPARIWGDPGDGNIWEPPLSCLLGPQLSYALSGCRSSPAVEEQCCHDGEHPLQSPAVPSGAFGDLILESQLPSVFTAKRPTEITGAME